VHHLVRPFGGTGILCGFATFSTYSVDVERLVAVGACRTGLVYLLATSVASTDRRVTGARRRAESSGERVNLFLVILGTASARRRCDWLRRARCSTTRRIWSSAWRAGPARRSPAPPLLRRSDSDGIFAHLAPGGRTGVSIESLGGTQNRRSGAPEGAYGGLRIYVRPMWSLRCSTRDRHCTRPGIAARLHRQTRCVPTYLDREVVRPYGDQPYGFGAVTP
jgi:hypothetical protein